MTSIWNFGCFVFILFNGRGSVGVYFFAIICLSCFSSKCCTKIRVIHAGLGGVCDQKHYVSMVPVYSLVCVLGFCLPLLLLYYFIFDSVVSFLYCFEFFFVLALILMTESSSETVITKFVFFLVYYPPVLNMYLYSIDNSYT